KGQGMTRILGPFNPSINEEVGLLIDGFDTPNVMLMPHGRPYYRALVEAQGYQKVKELYAYDFDVRPELDARFLKMEAWVDKNPDLEVRFIDKRNVQADIALALDIFNEAWRDNWGFTPMTDGEAERFGKSLALILQPDLGAFAYLKGEPIAFMITLPDLNSIIHDLEGKLFPLNWAKLLYRLKRKRFARARTPLLGVRKAHQNTRLGGMLSIYIISKIRRETLKYGMTHCELSWILEDNPGINNMLSSIGGEIYKRYGIFEKTL
ncbi:MAG: N-acetyltransferase, partial [Pseudomonadota bacterium]